MYNIYNVFALLMGGETSDEGYSTSMEMITPNMYDKTGKLSFDSIPLQALLEFFNPEKSIEKIALGKEIWMLLESEFSSFWADL